MTRLIALDTETHLLGPGAIAPKLVCVSLAYYGDTPGQIETDLYAHCDPALETLLATILGDSENHIVGQFIAYDMCVLYAYFPNLFPVIRKAYDEQRIHDTKIREKELALAQHGDLEFGFNEGTGKAYPRKFSLEEMAKNYMGIDLSDSKKSGDSWRLNYLMLDGVPAEEYPDEARTYAMLDAAVTLRIFEMQANQGEMPTATFHAAADFALYLASCRGFAIDQEARAKVAEECEAQLAPQYTGLLVEHGILRPGEEPRPKRGGGMTQGKKPSINKTILAAKVKAVCEAHGIEIKMTDGRVDNETGERVPAVSCDAEVMDRIAHLDPVLAQYAHRQGLQKLVTTELPRIDAPTVHPTFDVLKETGRTSSRASDLFPSCNIQNVDPRIRHCYIPRPGYLLLSVDYSSIELVTLAQKITTLFGHSALGDLINRGINPHDFLGAQMAYAFDAEFRQACDEAECDTREERYRVFLSLKKDPDEKLREFFHHYRTFAKPTGLGYPGGLGAETFVVYAKATYGVVITIEQALAFKEVWLDAYEGEMKRYFGWVSNGCRDPLHPEMYAYTSPLGMLRSNASYTAVANGAGMQTPAAEGGKLAFYEVSMQCYDHADPSQSPLFGCFPLAWIHDEVLMEIPDDGFSHERACAVSEIMVNCMSQITPDVKVRCEAKLMRRWYKQAQPVFDQAGRLVPWEPQPAT